MIQRPNSFRQAAHGGSEPVTAMNNRTCVGTAKQLIVCMHIERAGFSLGKTIQHPALGVSTRSGGPRPLYATSFMNDSRRSHLCSQDWESNDLQPHMCGLPPDAVEGCRHR